MLFENCGEIRQLNTSYNGVERLTLYLGGLFMSVLFSVLFYENYLNELLKAMQECQNLIDEDIEKRKDKLENESELPESKRRCLKAELARFNKISETIEDEITTLEELIDKIKIKK
jgi:hypothetical protein